MKVDQTKGFSERPLLEVLWIWIAAFTEGFALVCEEQRIVGNGRILGLGYVRQFYNIKLLILLGISKEFIEFQNESLGFVSVY